MTRDDKPMERSQLLCRILGMGILARFLFGANAKPLANIDFTALPAISDWVDPSSCLRLDFHSRTGEGTLASRKGKEGEPNHHPGGVAHTLATPTTVPEPGLVLFLPLGLFLLLRRRMRCSRPGVEKLG